MPAIDLSNYFAKRTLDYLRASVGVGGEGAFGYNPHEPNQLTLLRGTYRVSFSDQGEQVVVKIDSNTSFFDTKGLGGEVHVLRRYRGVVKDSRIERSEGGLAVVVGLADRDNTSHRSNNREKLFYGILNSGVKPALKKVLERHYSGPQIV